MSNLMDKLEVISALLTLLDRIEQADTLDEIDVLCHQRYDILEQIPGWTITFGEEVSGSIH